MLSKAICKNCRTNSPGDIINSSGDKHVWREQDDDMWNARPHVSVCCTVDGGFINALKPPPADCPYRFEHAIAEGMGHA